MNPRKYAGFSVLACVFLIIAVYKIRSGSEADNSANGQVGPAITVNGLIGGKEAFFTDPEISRILKERYGITVEYRRVGSLDMVKDCQVGLDYCWPSNQNSGQEITDKLGSAVVANKTIFHTPIVMYSWGPVANALIAQKIVEKRGDIFYVVDFPKLVQMMLDGTKWSDIGLPQIYGKVYVLTTDPAKSTTGNSYLGLVANALNGGGVVNHESLAEVMPQLQSLFGGRLLPENNTTLFEYYLTHGMGAAPIISAIESNLMEYSTAHPESQDFNRQNLVTLYPEPTVLTSQPLIALTDGGKRLMEALRDPEIERIGWEHHAFRSDVPGVPNDPTFFNVSGMRAADVDLVTTMPLPDVMNEIVQTLQETPTASTPTASIVR
jgi:hypothetical protein